MIFERAKEWSSRACLSEKDLEQEKFEREIFLQVSSLAEYIHENAIENIIFVDRSARPGAFGVIAYLRAKYPDIEMPKMYFINPIAFKYRQDAEMTDGDILKAAWEAINVGSSLDESLADDEGVVIDRVKDVHKYLFARRDKKTLLFDTCVHSGGTSRPVFDVLKKAGFNELKVGVSNVGHAGAAAHIDLDYEGPIEGKNGCFPFGYDVAVVKGSMSPISKRNNNFKAIIATTELRKVIRRAVNDGLAREVK